MSMHPSKNENITPGKSVDKMLAEDMNSLSLQERDVLYEEIHGVASWMEETPLFVSTSLAALDDELAKIKNKPAYDQAMIMNPDYVQDPEFCLQFLRAKSFHAPKAAAQLVSHLEIKQEVFGSHKLCEHIGFSDLHEEDREMLKTGAYQFIKTRDRAGRAICIFMNRLIQFKSFESWARTMFFMFMSYIKDKEVQRRGLVTISWMHGSSSSTRNDFTIWSRSGPVVDAMPLRISGGMHCCTDGTSLHPGLVFSIIYGRSHMRVRLRVHAGSPQECLYKLASYGIPLHALPIGADGEVNLHEHLHWYNQLETIAESSSTSDKSGLQGDAIIPSPTDILSGGRGKEFMFNPGNLALRKIVEETLPRYNSQPSRVHKTIIAQEIVQRIKSGGGRFLNREDAFTWREVDNDMAREKVAHLFRNLRRPVKKKKRTITANAETHGKDIHLINQLEWPT